MLKVGITGGIGSGKSAVCRVFEQLGIPVYYADEAGREVLRDDKNVVEEVKKIFGNDVYVAGELQRSKLAALVFNDKKKLEALNNIVHPAVVRHFEMWYTKQRNVPYVLKEAAILFESGTYKGLDKVITVTAPADLRIQRVMQRDGISKEQVEERMKNQISEEEKVKRSQYVIVNDEHQLLIPQVLNIHHQLLQLK